MTLNPQALTTALFVPLILFSLYRRFRRNFGRQLVSRKRLLIRMAVLAIVGITIAGSAGTDPQFLEAGAGGLAAGIALAFVGLRLTSFEASPEGEYYTPNVYIGILVSALFIGRLAYRLVVVAPAVQAAAQQGDAANPFGSFQRSPLTLALFALLIGYYISYSAGVLLKLRDAHPGTRRV